MKRVFYLFLVFLIAAGFANAKRGGSKAGSVKDGVYSDKSYGFSLVVPKTWDKSIKKDNKNVRMVLIKKEYEVPMQFQHAPNYTTVPKVTVYADTTSLALPVFVDSLLSDEFNTKQKKNLLIECKILFGDFMQKKRNHIKVGDLEGILISGNQRYTIQVARQGSESDRGDVVTDFYGGAVFFTKNIENNTLIVIHFICEDRYFDHTYSEFKKIVDTFKFLGK